MTGVAEMMTESAAEQAVAGPGSAPDTLDSWSWIARARAAARRAIENPPSADGAAGDEAAARESAAE